MFNIINKKIEDTLKYNEINVLKITIQYPQIIGNKYDMATEKFNQYYKKRAEEYYNYSKQELYKLAVEDYKISMENEYPIHEYEVFVESTITYNQNTLISLYTDKYEYTGGAHGNTIRDSQTWDMIYGKTITLNQFFNDCSYIIEILKSINKQIKEQIENGTNQYFDNYCELILNNFKEKNYYLTDSEIAIYFGQYEIAPYVSGIPVFLINLLYF